MNGLKVEGDPNEVDSFVACVTAVLAAWGRPVPYAEVAGLAGVTFTPVWDKGEDCTAWWMEGGADQRVAFVGQALGFTAEQVTRKQDFTDEVNSDYEATRALPPDINSYLARLKQALDQGDVVVMRTWPAWSVLSGWNDDIRKLPLATVPGFEGLCASIWGPHKSRLAYILSPAEAVLPRGQAMADAVRYGAAIAAPGYASGNLLYGGALYDAAAAHLDEAYFCGPCRERDWSCAHRTLKRMLGTARGAIDFASLAGGTIPEGACQDYAQMAGILSAYPDDKTIESRWHDDDFRRALAADFRALGALHRSAAQHLRAVAA